MTRSRYDLAVVGGGIAGLAISEIFARSGRSVLLLEKNKKLCQEASADQHGWFHLGSLYSIFPQNDSLKTLISGVEDLLAYYNKFPGMNISIDDAGHLAFRNSEEAWFRDEPLKYIVAARNNTDFNISGCLTTRQNLRKISLLLTWERSIKKFISRHQRFDKHDWNGNYTASEWIPNAGLSDYSRDVISKPMISNITLDIDTHFAINGYDRPMRSAQIVTELVMSLLGAGGAITTEKEIESISSFDGCYRIQATDGALFDADKVIFTSGKWLSRFMKKAGDVKVVASPLIVAYPELTDSHFVRLTPFIDKSINHLSHEVDGRKYSVIGGGHYANPEDAKAIINSQNQLNAMANLVFPKLYDSKILENYVGYKTEFIPGKKERNYQFLLREMDEGVFAAIPGKFSLAFSLATHSFKHITGETPSPQINLESSGRAKQYVGLTRHARIIYDQLIKLG